MKTKGIRISVVVVIIITIISTIYFLDGAIRTPGERTRYSDLTYFSVVSGIFVTCILRALANICEILEKKVGSL